MKILFLDYQHIPPSGATINCIQTLRKYLKRQGAVCDVLSLQPDAVKLHEQQDEYGKIYLETTWAIHGKMRRQVGEPLWKYFLRLPFASFFRALHRLLSDGYTRKEKIFSYKACGKFRKKLSLLCEQNHYDWVVAISAPYCMHDIAAYTDLHKTHLALYYLDPYAANALLAPENKKRRLKQECQNLAKADRAFASLEHREDWQSTALSRYLDKVQFIPYPNLTPDKESEKPGSISFAPDEIVVAYLGNFYDGVRYPRYMLSLVEEMVKLEPRLRLIMAGCIRSAEIERQIQDAQKKLQDHLTCLNTLPFSQSLWLIRRADCAVNLGNHMKNQMPSKILDYIAEGKPIINISHNRPCNTQAYTTRYPWTLQFFEDDLANDASMRDAAASAVQFVREHQGKQLPWETVEKCMAGFTSKDVAEHFLVTLEQTLPKT